MFSGYDRNKIFVVTSAGPGEGKSVTAANLAATMANDGIQVLLIDADLRRPTQHEIFGLENHTGLSTLLIANSDNWVRAESEPDKQLLTHLNQCIQSTEIPNLRVITSGFIPSNPTQVLRSSLMKRWMDAFKSARDIEVIIIDSPPVLLFGDSAILATTAEADALLVVDSQRTRVHAARETRDQLRQLGVTIRGVILNRINPRDEVGQYSYQYNYGYYYSAGPNGSEAPQSLPRRLWPWRRQA
jgi:Mrp family chromosome partitioning ATPase